MGPLPLVSCADYSDPCHIACVTVWMFKQAKLSQANAIQLKHHASNESNH